jgi:hypothetical protein
MPDPDLSSFSKYETCYFICRILLTRASRLRLARVVLRGSLVLEFDLEPGAIGRLRSKRSKFAP